jgi:hypothetical protein
MRLGSARAAHATECYAREQTIQKIDPCMNKKESRGQNKTKTWDQKVTSSPATRYPRRNILFSRNWWWRIVKIYLDDYRGLVLDIKRWEIEGREVGDRERERERGKRRGGGKDDFRVSVSLIVRVEVNTLTNLNPDLTRKPNLSQRKQSYQ